MTIRTTIPEHPRSTPAAAPIVRAARQRLLTAVLVTLCCLTAAAAGAAVDESQEPAQIERVRYSADGSTTRVIVILSRQVPYEVTVLPGKAGRGSKARLVVDFSNARLGAGAGKPIGVEDGLLQQIRTGQFTARTARVVLDLANVTKHTVSDLTDPPRVVIDIAGRPVPDGGTPTVARATDEQKTPSTMAANDAVATARAGDAAAQEPARAASTDGERATAARRESDDVAAPPRRASERRQRSEPGAERELANATRDGNAVSARESTANAPHFRAGGARSSTEPDELANAIRDAKPTTDTAASTAPSADGGRGENLRAVDGGRSEQARSADAPPADTTRNAGGAGAENARIATAERPSDQAPRETKPSLPASESRRERSDKRARGAEPQVVRRIVLDPGHGGNDPGAQGVDGVLEKDVTLALAKQLKRRLEDGLHAEVILTRGSDVTRSLAERTAFATARGADLFVSIHTNADAAGRLHGIETYTLNNSNDRATIRLAKMENGPAFRTPRGNLSFILSDLVQSGKEEESNALAERLQYRILSRLRNRYPDVRDLGVKRGPFYVLVGAYMPCVLVETSFLSHPVEGRRLATADYQAELVEGLYLGIADFFGDARLAKTL